MASESPQVVVDGRYRVLSVLGEGASAVVYLADQPPIGRRVAIKVLRSGLNDELTTRTLREAKVIASLKHPNIVTVHDYGTLEGRPYVVMEYVRGPTLSRVLKGGQRLDVDLALPLFEQIADALACAHRKGVVHRDIKPANILLERRTGRGDSVKVADFGVATTASSELTQAGTMIGTPAYMSPEQARGQAVDQRADLYSLGVLMFRTLTGRKPFTPTDPLAMALCHLNEPVPTFASVDPGIEVPPSLEHLVRRCLAKDPDQRYPSAEDLLTDLQAFRLGALAPEPTGGFTIEDTTVDTPVPAVIRRYGPTPWLVGSIGGVLIGMVAGVGWLLLDPPMPAAAPDGIVPDAVAEADAVRVAARQAAVPWGDRPVQWRGSSSRRPLSLDLAPVGSELEGTLTLQLGQHAQRVSLSGVATAGAGDDEVMLTLENEQGWLLTGSVTGTHAAGALEGPGVEPRTWIASGLGAAPEAPAAPAAAARAPEAAAPTEPAPPAGTLVRVEGDASRVWLVDATGRRQRVPALMAPGDYRIVALFPGTEPVDVGAVTVGDAEVELACASFAARCKPR